MTSNQGDAMASNGSDAMLSPADNAASNTLNDVRTAVTTTPSPQEFVDQAGASDQFETAAAKIAKQRSQSADVKAFAAMMIKDHTQSTADIKKAAAKANPPLTPKPVLTSDEQSELDQLNKTSANDFDKTYFDGQVGAHRKALALMQRYADSGSDPQLKATAAKLVPIIQHHLDTARGDDEKADKRQ
ncbi:MAG: DUF4142 domain-containing protein [Sphingomonas sp.]